MPFSGAHASVGALSGVNISGPAFSPGRLLPGGFSGLFIYRNPLIFMQVTMLPIDWFRMVGRPKPYLSIFDHELSVLTKKIYHNVLKEAPERTGKLKSNVDKVKVVPLHYEIREPGRDRVEYAVPVRTGVRSSSINPILPNVKKALWWPGLPHPINIVQNHPGLPENDYYKRGLDNSIPAIDHTAAILGRKISVRIRG